ncbi:transcriptional regulator BetI [Pseudooceanicola sp. GBMRC 2024]|uniref:Transcriptional regulator BetI n=1 Tax=Pseudooceanicola albus TaxID=2692189 RepID=A0A6L7G333_9RHOB|nr:transcriptional regulator BetI [Pseudooceanicola albus]
MEKSKEKKKITLRSELRRQQLLEAGLKAIARRGLTGITINDIAEEAQVSYGVIAFHFQNKERMLLAVLDHLVSQYEAVCAEAMAGAGEDPAERLRTLIAVDFDARVAKTRYLAVWMAFWAEAGRVPAYRRRCTELKDGAREMMRALVAELAARHDRSAEAAQIADELYAITDGIWLSNHVTGRNGPAARRAGAQACLGYLARAFPGDFAP